MPKLLDPQVDTIIKTLSKEKYSIRNIKHKLEEDDIEVSIGTICNVLNGIGIRRQALNHGQEIPKHQYPPSKRTPEVIHEVSSMVLKENPATYVSISKKVGLANATIFKVIHQDLKKQTRKKTKVHRLDTRSKQNRKTNCRKLYENHLSGDRAEFAVTLDEALVYEDSSNRPREICYLSAGESVPESWINEQGESFPHSFMVNGVITGRGTVLFFKVPGKVKICAEYYVNYVLKPLFEEHLPRIYGADIDKVFFHHDKAPPHRAAPTTAYLEEQKREKGIDYIKPQEIPVRAPDTSPLDFFGFGYLKQELKKRRARTLDGVWKLAREVWSTIDQPTIDRVFAAWKRRCRAVSRGSGEHIEQTKTIHRRRVFKNYFEIKSVQKKCEHPV